MIPVDGLARQQKAIFAARGKYIFVCGGVGTYKTTGGLLRMYEHCHEFPGQNIFVLAQTLDQVKEIYYREWLRQIPSDRYNYNANDHVIELPKCDGRIRMLYAMHKQAGERIMGSTISGYHIIQAETITSPTLFHALEQRVRLFPQNDDRHIRLIDANPGAPGHWVYELFVNRESEKFLGRGAGTLSQINVRTTASNSVYSQETLDEWKRTYPSWLYARMVDGEWTKAEGVIYDKFEDVSNITTDIIDEYWVGIDPGEGEHPWAMVWVGRTKADKFLVFDERTGTQTDLDDLIGIFDDVNKYWGAEKCRQAVFDWHGIAYRKHFQRSSTTCKTHVFPAGNRNKWFEIVQGVLLVRQDLVNGKLAIGANLRHTKKDMTNYVWGQNGKPDKKAYDAHMLDALRYVWIRVGKNE